MWGCWPRASPGAGRLGFEEVEVLCKGLFGGGVEVELTGYVGVGEGLCPGGFFIGLVFVYFPRVLYWGN